MQAQMTALPVFQCFVRYQERVVCVLKKFLNFEYQTRLNFEFRYAS